MNTISKSLFLSLFSLFFCIQVIYAGTERFDNRIDLTSNGYVSVSDDKLPVMLSGSVNNWGFANSSSVGIVRLIFDNYNPDWDYFEDITAITTVEVPVTISGIKYNYETGEAESFTYDKILSVKFAANGMVVRDMSSFSVDGAHQISAISFGDASDQDILDYMAIEVAVEVERYYDLESTYSWDNMTISEESTSSSIKFAWDGILGAEGYEIEYSYINGQAPGGTYGAGWVDPYLFRFNSTRIRTSKSTFTIPNIYNMGDIVFRVRAYGKKYIESSQSFEDFYTAWSHSDNTEGGSFTTVSITPDWISQKIGGSIIPISPDGSQFNKQTMANFAEDGKSKYSINYFDGSLRSRQSQVKLNSENIVLVGETKYDFLGRAAISILPVPKSSAILSYVSNFNKDDLGGEYNASDYDETLLPTSLSNTIGAGAGHYYSTTNTSADSKYIPDAGGYPLVRTIYTSDNTGRVSVQGGLGPVFQPGATTDRTTRYYYGTPAQEELDALFGSEVGYSQYYTKELVCDPNAQKTVTYKDLKGNVIATGLAGETPDNLLPVSSDPSETNLHIDLLSNGTQEPTVPGEIVLTYSIMSDREQDVNVNYLLNGTEFSTTCENDTYCMDCVYDLEISITDQDGNAVEYNYPTAPLELEVNQTVSSDVITLISNPTNAYDITGTDCSNPDYEGDISFDWDSETGSLGQVHLNEGVYYITRRLRLNTQALAHYTNEYLQEITSATGCLYLDDLITEYQSTYVNYPGCDYTCSDCQIDYNDALANGTQEEIAAMAALMELICNTENNPMCDYAYSAMLNDVSPHGQYGEIQENAEIIDGCIVEPDNDIVDPGLFRLSIFNEDNFFPYEEDSGTDYPRTWRRPYNNHYHNDDYSISYIPLTYDGSDYTPAVNPSDVVTIDNEPFAEPHKLLDVLDFISYWQESWAEDLVHHHPEYGYYEICNDIQESHNFDFLLLECDTLSTEWSEYLSDYATSSQFVADPTAYDPLFTTTSTPQVVWPFGTTGDFTRALVTAQFETMMTNFLTINPGEPTEDVINIWQATFILTNPDCVGDCGGTCDYTNHEFTSSSTASDAYWANFRMLYYSLKQRLINFVTTQYAIENNFYNGCISVEEDWGTSDGFFASGDAFDENQYCYFQNAHEYSDKTPRFPNFSHFQDGNLEQYATDNCYSSGTWGALAECPEGLDEVNETMNNYTDLYFYDQCDQCPVERDLQALFIGLLDRGELLLTEEVDGISLNCNVPEYFMDLHEVLASDPTNSMFHESLFSSSTSQELDLELSEDNTSNTCNIKMVIDQDFNTGDITLYSFEDIAGFCCLYDYEGSFQFTSDPEYGELNDFTITALVTIDSSDPDYDSNYPNATKEIIVYGAISCIDFTGCTFDPVCRLNNVGEQLETAIKGGDSGSQHFTNTFGPYSLATVEAQEAFPDMIDALYNCSGGGPDDYYWTFNTSITNYSTLTMTFDASDATYNDVVITFDLTTTNTMTGINQVSAIRPVLDEPGMIEIRLVYTDGTNSFSEWFPSSTTTCLNIGECYDDQLPPAEGLITNNSSGNYNQEECYPTTTNIDEIYVQGLLSDMFDEFMYDFSNWNCVDGDNCHYSRMYNDCRFDFEPALGYLHSSTDYESYSSPTDLTINDDNSFGFFVKMEDGNSIPERVYVTATCYDCFNPEFSCWGDNIDEDYISSLINPVFYDYIYEFNNWTLDGDDYVIEIDYDDIHYFFSMQADQNANSSDLESFFAIIIDDGYPIDNVVAFTGGFEDIEGTSWKFGCKMTCLEVQPLAYTCNEQETLELMSNINNYLDEYSISNSTITFNSGQSDECDIEFFVPEGHYDDIDTYQPNSNATTSYSPSNIVEISEMAGYNSYNDYDGADLFDDMIDFEVYARMADNDIKLFYASSGCLVPDCWCDKALTVPNGDFSIDGDYSGGSIDYEFTTDVTSSTLADLTNGTFESTSYHQFNSTEIVDEDNNYVAYDFVAAQIDPEDYDITLWSNTFELEPFTEYNLKVTLIDAGTDDIHIDLRDITSGYDVSLFNNRAGYLSHADVPEGVLKVYEPNTNGVYLDFEEVIGTTEMNEVVLRGTFYSGTRTEIDLGIILEVSYSNTYCIALDNVILEKQETCACEIHPPSDAPSLELEDCQDVMNTIAENQAIQYYEEQIDNYTESFQNNYIDHCLSNMLEEFTIDMALLQQSYTLYYYDLAGNLIKTVPPKGVKYINIEDEDIVDDRENKTNNFSTPHTMSTVYEYNTLGQLTAQYMPDHEQFKGSTTGINAREDYSMMFWYDKLGRIVASQNSKQYNQTYPDVDRIYSYTLYDNLGRVTESGVIDFGATDFETTYVDGTTKYVTYHTFRSAVNSNNDKTEIVKTTYDYATTTTSIPGFTQENLRNRVSYSTIDENGDGDYEFATYYSYDIHGNVKSLVHEIVELADIEQNFKRIDYDYDLISGNVNKVSYQNNEPDQFHHRYYYDDDNRITHVETSDDGINWLQDAKYFYYKHGPLARVELGNDKVQALDYAYTLQGWLKGVNSDILNPEKDMGRDAYVDPTIANNNQYVGTDQFGFSLGYFDGDYSPVNNTGTDCLASTSGSNLNTAREDLFNGNISHMVSSSKHVNDQSQTVSLGFAYQYDQLNRIRHMATFENLVVATNSWGTHGDSTSSAAYTYDKNGNLMSLERYNRKGDPLTSNTPVKFDDFTYAYDETTHETNRLLSISEDGNTTVESVDFDGTTNPYEYDEIGNLTEDLTEGIDAINWTNSGKVESVERTTGSTNRDLYFKYDPTGNRIAKYVENTSFSPLELDYYTKTYYLRDAQGNVMAVYTRTYDEEVPQEVTMSFSELERSVYGSSRIANFVDSVQLVSMDASENYVYYDSPEIMEHNNGTRHFELTNHLGNVMAVVTDKRLPVLDATATAIESFQPELLLAKDYYPFGMEMSGRYGGDNGTEPDDEYRYGFQNQEKDDEWTGQTGSHLNYKYRMYDSRTGRFFAIDPLAAQYPYNSTYAFSENRVIDGVELEGLEWQLAIGPAVGIGVGVVATYVLIRYMVENEPPKIEIDKINFSSYSVSSYDENARWRRQKEQEGLEKAQLDIINHWQSCKDNGYEPDPDNDNKFKNLKDMGIAGVITSGIYGGLELINTVYEEAIREYQINQGKIEQIEKKRNINQQIFDIKTYDELKEELGDDWDEYMKLQEKQYIQAIEINILEETMGEIKQAE